MKPFKFILLIALISSCSSKDKAVSINSVNQCIGAGPQSPRDIDSVLGINSVSFNMAPKIKNMNLCNVHFHRNAEHRSKNFSTFVRDGDHSGWACKAPTKQRLSKSPHIKYKGCKGITAGDTIEVHWVYTSCDTQSDGVETLGAGLSACMTTLCSNPSLKVESQVFLLEKNGKLKFNSAAPVSKNANSVSFIGSTTGTSFNNQHCSPLQVSWNVRKSCSTLDIDSFSNWCAENKYNEDHAHGVRELIEDIKLLSPISK